MREGGSRNRRAPVELESYALRQRGLELYVITKTHGYRPLVPLLSAPCILAHVLVLVIVIFVLDHERSLSTRD